MSKELLLLHSDNNVDKTYDSILDDFIVAEKKLHIFAVINLAKSLEDMAPSLLKNKKVQFVRFYNFNYKNMPESYVSSFCVELFNKNLDVICNSRDNHELFNIIGKHRFKLGYTNNFDSFNINLEENISEQIYASLLSPDLKIALEYNQISLSVIDKKQDLPKRHKI